MLTHCWTIQSFWYVKQRMGSIYLGNCQHLIVAVLLGKCQLCHSHLMQVFNWLLTSSIFFVTLISINWFLMWGQTTRLQITKYLVTKYLVTGICAMPTLAWIHFTRMELQIRSKRDIENVCEICFVIYICHMFSYICCSYIY